MTVTLEMESYSEMVFRRTANFSFKGVTVVTTLQDINGSERFMDKLLEHIKWLEADSVMDCVASLITVAILQA